ncbi:MAG: tyrosine-type recombinase/integrase [Roseomonas sp.]|nr:tyrosine-type recombinase/integrase [Roseomonas sp.]
MKPPRPRIVKPRLVWRLIGGNWTPFHRVTWTEGTKRKAREIKLDWKGDPRELDRLYWLAQAGQHQRQEKPARYTWQDCIIAWRKDLTIQRSLAAGTKVSYRRPMDAIMEKNAAKDMRLTKREHVRAALGKLADTPRKASAYAQTISLLWNYAQKELDWPLGENPAKGLAKFTPEKPFEPWPEWMVKALDSAPERVRTAARLILGTGQRPGAAITMRRDAFDGEWMTVRDEKGDKDMVVYCPASLRQYVDSLPVAGAHVLPKNLTEPQGYWAIEAAFSKWRDTLGEKAKRYSLHGLRKLAIVQLAEAGASDAEIQAVTGQSAAVVAYYRSQANKRQLSRVAQGRREKE